MGGKVVWEMVEARPSRECGIRAPGTQDVEGDFGIGEETIPEVVRKVRVDEKTEMRWFLPVLTALSAGLELWVNLWGHKRHRQPLREKVLSAL